MYLSLFFLGIVGALAVRLLALFSPDWLVFVQTVIGSDVLIVVVLFLLIVGAVYLVWILNLRRRYGVVFDVMTHEPVDLVVVTVTDSTGKKIASSITDMAGRYAFLLDPGDYRIMAERTHFEFPSPHSNVLRFDTVYGHYFVGEPISLTKQTVVGMPLGIGQTTYDWNHLAKVEMKKGVFDWKLVRFTYLVTAAFLCTCLLVFSICIIFPATSSVLLSLFYLWLVYLRFQWKLTVSPGKIVGVTETVTIRAVSQLTHVTVAETVSRGGGSYYLLVPPGTYTLELTSAAGVDKRVIKKVSDVRCTDGYINYTITV